MTNESVKPPVWFWIVAVVALLWNAMGALAYIGQAYMTEEMLATMSEAEQELQLNRPAWVTAAFAIAVFGGTLASIAMLMRKKLAYLLFIISLAGVLVQNIHGFFLSNTLDVMGPQAVYFPILVIIIGVVLILISKKGKENGWLS